jgi:hypothetical protein
MGRPRSAAALGLLPSSIAPRPDPPPLVHEDEDQRRKPRSGRRGGRRGNDEPWLHLS